MASKRVPAKNQCPSLIGAALARDPLERRITMAEIAAALTP